MKPRAIILLFAALIPLRASAGQEVGEWALDDAFCDQSRIVFTADGLHESRVLEDGSWKSLASAPYRREGDMLTIETPETTERLEVLEESSDRLVLRNTDVERHRRLGTTSLELVRCPISS